MGDDGSRRERRFGIRSRLARIEKRINSMDDELQIVRSDMIDKHKEAIKQINKIKTDVSGAKEEIEEVRKLANRSTNILGEFASKESVKTLEKYINLWKPIDYITRAEAKKLIAEALPKKKKRGRKKKSKSKKSKKKSKK